MIVLRFLVLLFLLFSGSTFGATYRFIVPKDGLNSELQQAKVVHSLDPLPWVVVESEKKIDSGFRDLTGHISLATQSTTPSSSSQWLSSLCASDVWSKTTGDGLIIALIDTGVDWTHEGLSGNVLYDKGYDFGDNDHDPSDENGHGTLMAGLIAGNCMNSKGFCGVAPNAKIIPFKINRGGEGSFYSSDLAAAIIAAATTEASIINLSLTIDSEVEWVKAAIEYARSRGKIVVAAAGNSGMEVAVPARFSTVIGVGAIDANNHLIQASNRGEGLSLVAPGLDLMSTWLGHSYIGVTGTSPAAAIVSGVIALYMSSYPNDAPENIMARVLESAVDLYNPGFDPQSGFGLVNACSLASKDGSQGNPDVPRVKLGFSGDQGLSYGDRLEVSLSLINVSGGYGDIAIRINGPIDYDGRRTNTYYTWPGIASSEPVLFTQPFGSPVLFTEDIENFVLVGAKEAPLGDGIIPSGLPEGPYEIGVGLVLNGTLYTARKVIWIRPTGL
ncbi:S8 family peptidase [Dissulfuribacter thermophilus]|uniref:S8 family peptidase n=1 Tax=Dissulfuribacter thermophilus TaxID=1156395 RepID=UPI00137B11F5|nr:S8 family serine peptidase [Dissulfuribacter thermophilus]